MHHLPLASQLFLGQVLARLLPQEVLLAQTRVLCLEQLVLVCQQTQAVPLVQLRAMCLALSGHSSSSSHRAVALQHSPPQVLALVD